MIILTLLGLLSASAALYWFIIWFNGYTYACERYEFFTLKYSIAIIFSYAMIFIGTGLFKAALVQHGDSLNGALMIVIGVSILLWVINTNFKNVSVGLALLGTIAQLILYIPIAICAIIIIFAMIAFFSETKPVYNINSKD